MPPWLMFPNHLNKLSFSRTMEASAETWLRSALAAENKSLKGMMEARWMDETDNKCLKNVYLSAQGC